MTVEERLTSIEADIKDLKKHLSATNKITWATLIMVIVGILIKCWRG